MNEKIIVKENGFSYEVVDASEKVNKIEVLTWENAQTILGVLLDNGYMARITRDERTYVIEYDWQDEDYSGKRLIWVEEI